VPSASATTLGKDVACTAGSATCVELAINVPSNNPFSDGPAATQLVTIPANAPLGSTITFSPLTGTLAADINGTLVPTTAGPGFSATVFSCDVNQDGKVDS